MTNNQKTLRTVAKFLSYVAEGAPIVPQDFKTMADLCWLSVPISQRMDKAEVAELKSHPWNGDFHKPEEKRD